MAKTKIEFEVEVPEGYEYIGEIRTPREGEWYLSNVLTTQETTAQKANYSFTVGMYPILRKSQVWKQLTPEKALAFMLAKTPVTMRYKNWAAGRQRTEVITNMYMHCGNHAAIDLDGRGVSAHICNVFYLVEGDNA